MKKRILLVLIVFLVVSCNTDNKNNASVQMSTDFKTINIKGSENVLPLSQKAVELYLKEHPTARLTITGGGSGVGISALIAGTTDIAQASRKIKFDERQKVQERGNTVKEVIIAYDALAIIVHQENKVLNLTREQLEGIFTGKIKNWKEVGGEDLKKCLIFY